MFSFGPKSKISLKKTSVTDTWKQGECVLDGDMFRCRMPTSYFGKAKNRMLGSGTNSDKTSNGKREIQLHLADCSVKLVHKVLAGRNWCFLLSSSKQNVLFQAENQTELISWMGALTHAIDVSNGRLVGHKCSRPLRNRVSFFDRGDDLDRHDDTEIVHALNSELNIDLDGIPSISSPRRRRYSDELIKPKALSPTSELPLPENLVFLQHSNAMVDAIQLMRKHVADRLQYWPRIFSWAMDDINVEQINALVTIPLSTR